MPKRYIPVIEKLEMPPLPELPKHLAHELISDQMDFAEGDYVRPLTLARNPGYQRLLQINGHNYEPYTLSLQPTEGGITLALSGGKLPEPFVVLIPRREFAEEYRRYHKILNVYHLDPIKYDPVRTAIHDACSRHLSDFLQAQNVNMDFELVRRVFRLATLIDSHISQYAAHGTSAAGHRSPG